MADDDNSWNRLPQAKVRIPESGLKSLLEGLGPEGFAIGYRNKIQLVDDGILVTLETNVGKYPNIVPFPIDIFIPVPAADLPKVQDDNEVETKPEEPQSDLRKLTELPSKPEDIALVSSGDDSGVNEHSDGLRSHVESTPIETGTGSVGNDSAQSGIGNDVLDSEATSTS